MAADKHHGAELDHGGVDAERHGGVFVLAHRDQPGAEAGPLEQLRDHQRDRDQREDDPIEHSAAFELERSCVQVELDQGADAGPGDRRDAGDDAQHLGEGERHERKIRAAQLSAEHEPADERADRGGGGNAGGKTDPGIDAVAHLQHASDISAGAEEGRVPERVLSTIAAEDVPALPGERDQQCDH